MESILQQKSFAFALKVIDIYKQIVSSHKEYVLGRQILKSGTAIGALIREAEYAQSKADFISKMSISLKESNETEYWLLLLRDSGYLEKEKANEMIANNKELIKMLISSINTTKKSLKSN